MKFRTYIRWLFNWFGIGDRRSIEKQIRSERRSRESRRA